ncbi:hypothetical protein AVEN_251007-1 [Araneus ventricosus]|uniref:Uncharacterized protein n=1 Tax=Araneus ventricosus TaxID=182803 RepID=A0A4Y2FGG9_ARAVE|nr:hypothetical protein AVEN_251007-1 [Araneus ventricosus]
MSVKLAPADMILQFTLSKLRTYANTWMQVYLFNTYLKHLLTEIETSKKTLPPNAQETRRGQPANTEPPGPESITKQYNPHHKHPAILKPYV